MNEPNVIVSILVTVEPGLEQQLQKDWSEHFLPAIRQWPGFVSCQLLRSWPRSGEPDDLSRRFRIDLEFETEAQRTAWAASSEHRVAYGRMIEGASVESARFFNVDPS